MINLLRGWLHIYSYSRDMVFGANGETDMHINSKHSGNRCRSSVIIVVLAKYYFFIQLLVQLREVFKINNWNGGVWMRGTVWGWQNLYTNMSIFIGLKLLEKYFWLKECFIGNFQLLIFISIVIGVDNEKKFLSVYESTQHQHLW